MLRSLASIAAGVAMVGAVAAIVLVYAAIVSLCRAVVAIEDRMDKLGRSPKVIEPLHQD